MKKTMIILNLLFFLAICIQSIIISDLKRHNESLSIFAERCINFKKKHQPIRS